MLSMCACTSCIFQTIQGETEAPMQFFFLEGEDVGWVTLFFENLFMLFAYSMGELL